MSSPVSSHASFGPIGNDSRVMKTECLIVVRWVSVCVGAMVEEKDEQEQQQEQKEELEQQEEQEEEEEG